MDAELFLFIFLPPLVFGEAMTQNMFHLRKAAGQAFLLAGPGVVIGTFLFAALTKLILPASYHWSWTYCLLFGSILSATDTVSVLSLLHSAATSPKLTIVIVGESLANDGTAMILFSLFLQALQGEVFTPANLAIFF
jgi:NhaP-type Na+/H+ or K+/H+ antiporter